MGAAQRYRHSANGNGNGVFPPKYAAMRNRNEGPFIQPKRAQSLCLIGNKERPLHCGYLRALADGKLIKRHSGALPDQIANCKPLQTIRNNRPDDTDGLSAPIWLRTWLIVHSA